jgi:hypothetical protein
MEKTGTWIELGELGWLRILGYEGTVVPSLPTGRDMSGGGQVKLLVWILYGASATQRLSTRCEDVMYPKREDLKCHLGSLG